MATALFINGIYGSVLADIQEAQEAQGGGVYFLQPHHPSPIVLLRKQQPSPEEPIRFYASTTENLSQICYTGEIIGWEDKREITDHRRNTVRRRLKKFQPGEVDLLMGVQSGAEESANLISIRNLRQLKTTHTTAILRKTKGGKPLEKRTRPGGWSEVYDLGDLIDWPPETRSQLELELAAAIKDSKALSDAALWKRLSSAAKLPEKVQVISVAYRRNSDVIVAVLRRANGICERCDVPAPFLRHSDGSPYLEVHHLAPLSQGGEDTIKNAAALCPNCHREVHYGQSNAAS